MGIIKRNEKKLTIQEMDANLDYLNSNNILDVDYYYDNNNLVIRRPDEIEINLNIDSYNIEGRYNIDDDNTTIYKFSQYEEFEEPTKSITLKYRQNGTTLPVLFEDNKSFNIDINLGYWNNNVYNSTTIKSLKVFNPDWDSTKIALRYGFNGTVSSIVIQDDGKILVGGYFTSYNGVTSNYIIRLNPDGSQDTSFDVGTGFNNYVDSIVIQSDGKILVGGQFSSYNGVTSSRIIRLNTDGSQDTSFVIGTGFSYHVNSIVIQSDGSILVGGRFTSYNGVSAYRMIRLNSDGSRDTSFVIGTGFNNSVYSIAVQSDGKILVGGDFTSYNGVTSNRIIRLNSDGSQDTSFVIGTGFSTPVFSIAIQDDGKILLVGYFSSYNGVSSNRIIRLNSDGSQDTSFVIGTGFDSTVNSIAIQDNGKILVGGQFTSYNGVTSNRIIRLNSDGSQDTSFNIGTGFSSTIYSFAIQDDGKILVGGSFTSYNQTIFKTFANSIIRLNSDGVSNTQLVYQYTKINNLFKTNYDDNFELVNEDGVLKILCNNLLTKVAISYKIIII